MSSRLDFSEKISANKFVWNWVEIHKEFARSFSLTRIGQSVFMIGIYFREPRLMYVNIIAISFS